MLFGFALEQVYLTILIIAGLGTVLYLFFSDMAEGVSEGIPFFDPAVIMAFITFTAASGYILEKVTSLSSTVVFLIAVIIGVILSLLLFYFVLVPLKSAEVSLAYTEESLGGQVGKVIVPIPKDGFGEIVIKTVNGVISKRATGYENEEIEYDKEVLIIEVKDGTVYVKEYESSFNFK